MSTSPTTATTSTLPAFDSASFETTTFLEYISGDIIENLSKGKQEILDELLENLSQDSFIYFSSLALRNKELGTRAAPIHPLNTFEFFLSTPERIEKLKKMYSKEKATTSLYNPLAKGFAFFQQESLIGYIHFLKIRHNEKSLLFHLDDFCRKTKKNKELLTSFIETENWQGFVEEILVNN